MGRRLRIAVVNRFAPPDAAVTGRSAHELALVLQAALPAAEVRLYATTASYAGGSAGHKAGAVEIHRLPAAKGGARGLARLGAALVEGWRLAQAATGWADLVVSLTDPPLLGLWLGLLRRLRWHPIRWAEWTMDLYPEAFAAAGLAGRGSPLLAVLRRLAAWSRPDLYLALGPQQRDAVLAWRRATTPSVLLPCGILPPLAPRPAVPAWREGERRTVLAYAGNVGEAHCAAGLVRLVRMAEPESFAFVLALYGSRAGLVREALADAPNVTWVPRLSHEELLHADVHVASLRPEWSHVCVPSKAVSSLCLGRPVLFIGGAASDIWQLSQRAGWCVPVLGEDDAEPEALRRALDEMREPGVLARHAATALARGEALRRLERGSLGQLVAWCDQAAATAPVARPLPEAA